MTDRKEFIERLVLSLVLPEKYHAQAYALLQNGKAISSVAKKYKVMAKMRTKIRQYK